MKKILFVCHGNICRSPMAEFYFKRIVERAGLKDVIYVESAATSNEEIGNPVYTLAKRQLAQRGIGCKDKVARRVTRQDYKDFDQIIVMDDLNVNEIMSILGKDPQHKVSKLMAHAGLDQDVFDPWYTRDFDKAWQDITTGCDALLEELKSNIRNKN